MVTLIHGELAFTSSFHLKKEINAIKCVYPSCSCNFLIWVGNITTT